MWTLYQAVDLMKTRGPTLRRTESGSGFPPSLPSTAAASPPRFLKGEEISVAGGREQRSPACPLHGVYISETDVSKEASPADQDSGSDESGRSGRCYDILGDSSSGSSQIDRRAHTNRRLESSCDGQGRDSCDGAVGRGHNGNGEEGGHLPTGDVPGSTRASSKENDDSGTTRTHRHKWEEDRKSRQLVIFRNCVYDLADFHHPGGDDLLEDRYGTDITGVFEEVGHSAAAYKLLDTFLVGIVAERRQAYMKQVGAAVCLCPGGASTGNKVKSPMSGEADDAKDEDQRATGLLTQATPPKLIPTGPDGYPVHHLLDFHHPLLSQIFSMSREEYMELVNSHALTTKVVPLMPYAWYVSTFPHCSIT